MITAITAVFRFLYELIKFEPLRNWLKKDKAGEVIVRTAAMYDIMHNMVNVQSEYKIQRFLIISAHNGGENMHTFSPQFTTCRHEAIRPPVTSVRNDYQKLPTDHEYTQILMNVYVHKFVELHTDEMPECLLKSIYQKEGVKHSRLFFIQHTKKEFIFGSIATVDDDREILKSPKVDIALRVAAAKLKQLMK
jgi:hypothetical protein